MLFRSIKLDATYVIAPTGPCSLCKSKKIQCSLMPKNPAIGKADRHTISREDVLLYCLKLVEKSRANIVRGKQCADNPPDVGEPNSSTPSSLAQLAGLDSLTLDSGGSSAMITPADSPDTGAQPSLPGPPASASQLALKTGKASKTRK